MRSASSGTTGSYRNAWQPESVRIIQKDLSPARRRSAVSRVLLLEECLCQEEDVISLNDYKLVAPDIDSLLNCFERGFLNPSAPSEALCKAMDPLFEMLREMAPLRKNDEAKAIWVTIPRGSIEDFGSYEDMLEWGRCKEP